MPNICHYTATVQKKTVSNPRNNVLCGRRLLQRQICSRETSFLRFSARQIEPFLQFYQTDAPMTSFLFHDLMRLTKNIMARFITSEAMTSVNSLLDLDTSVTANKVESKDVDVGLSAAVEVTEKLKFHVIDLQVMTFH